MDTLPPRLMENAEAVNDRLAVWFADAPVAGEIARPARLMAAIRHGALDGGKRLRPHLVIEAARLFGAARETALETACALEAIHCYSLIHDDLPAMDDDDTRRGRPTVHIAYDEATAILAGDALLTHAFERVAADGGLIAETRCQLAVLLARAAGQGGMIGGQMFDMEAETAAEPLDDAAIRRLQAMKTGALIAFACEAGAVIGGADGDARERLARFGRTIGLAFQLADDLLDTTADAATMGKATAKDAAAGKATLVALHGAAAVRAMLADAVEEAETELAPFGTRADGLMATARFVVERES